MRAYQVYVRVVVAVLVLLAGSSASEAGWFRGGHTCYYYAADSTRYATTSPATAAAPTRAVVPAPSGPVVHQTNKPIIGAEQVQAASPTATNYTPSATIGGGWSVMPRSSWDFGRLPPYR
ncbi:MAG: hypothetical protein ACLP9L_20470 [Thermoguttaceae bacterium]